MDRPQPARLLAGATAGLCAIATLGASAAPVVATAQAKTAKHSKHKAKHHSKRHHHKRKHHHTPKPAPAGQSAMGDVIAGPFRAQFTASLAAGAPSTAATGTFTAQTLVDGTPVMTVSGPVTCLDVVGNRMGLFYPIKSSSIAPLASTNSGVYFYAQLDASGKPQSATFVPVPVSHVTACPPQPGLIPISKGTLTLSP